MDSDEKRGWWIGWYNTVDLATFELHSPWWISGYRDDDETMVAAVWAADEDEAFEIVRAAYDEDPGPLERRLAGELEPDDSPFSDRFPQSAWMAWDGKGKTCGCSQHE